MKVCFIYFGFYPQSSLAAFYEYTQGLSRAGTDVTVYCRKKGPDADEMMGDVKVEELCPNTQTTKLAHAVFLFKAIFMLKREKFDVIHVFWSTCISVLPLIVGKKGMVWVLDIRTSNIYEGVGAVIKDWATVFDSYSFDAVSILGEHLKRRLFGDKENEKHYIFPMGANHERFKVVAKDESILDKWNLSSRDNILIYIGKLDVTRNLDILLLGFKKAVQTIKDLKFILVGGTEDDVKRLKEIARANFMEDKVIFTGLISYKDIPKYLSIADAGMAYMTKSGVHNAQPPLKTLEYLASSLPIVATDTDGNKDYVTDGYNGVLCSDTPDAIGAAIVRLMSDESLYKKIRANARESVSKYDWEKIVHDALLPLYKKLLN